MAGSFFPSILIEPLMGVLIAGSCNAGDFCGLNGIDDLGRIGNHCTNIAEWVELSVTGIRKDCQ
jgi:hypothetical protein